MTYLLRAKRGNGRHIKILAGVIFFCILAGLFARSFVAKSFANFSHTFNTAIYSILPGGLRSVHELGIQNRALERRINELVAANADRNVLANENERLKAGLGREEGEKIIYATILKRPPESLYDTFILDAGEEQGVLVDDSVVFGSVLIGTIIESGNGYSKAKLFSSPGNTFSGMLAGTVEIEAKGLGGGAFEIMAPLGVTVTLGDALILPAISSKIFGLVQNIEEMQSEGFKKILFSLPINLNHIDSVGIIVR